MGMILYVDDNPGWRREVRQIIIRVLATLDMSGRFNLMEASTGAQALQIIDEQTTGITLLVTDNALNADPHELQGSDVAVLALNAGIPPEHICFFTTTPKAAARIMSDKASGITLKFFEKNHDEKALTDWLITELSGV